MKYYSLMLYNFETLSLSLSLSIALSRFYIVHCCHWRFMLEVPVYFTILTIPIIIPNYEKKWLHAKERHAHRFSFLHFFFFFSVKIHNLSCCDMQCSLCTGIENIEMVYHFAKKICHIIRKDHEKKNNSCAYIVPVFLYLKLPTRKNE